MDAQPEIVAEYAIKSYRYLRLTIVVMVLSVVISVLLERRDGSCTLPSVSAYYYTPVHAVFIGALVAVGGCLIAIKGTREWEDMCLNVAGMLAPIVAFVPTNRPDEGDACGSPLMVVADFDGSPFVANNVTALAVSGVIVVVVAYVIAYRGLLTSRQQLGATAKQLDASVWIGLLLAVAILVGLFWWYQASRETFLENAHDYTAIAMIVMIGLVVLVNAIRSRSTTYRVLYWCVAVAMAAAAVAVLIGVVTASGWEHEVITIEALEIALFGVFWVIQTVEYWTVGIAPVPPPAR